MGIVSALVGAALSVVKAFTNKPTVTSVFMHIVGLIPNVISQVDQFGDLSTEAKVDDALAAFDKYTGSDEGAIDVVRDLPADKEEELFDHVKGILGIILKNRLKIKGYFV